MDPRREALSQLRAIKARAAEVIPEAALLAKLEASIRDSRPLRVKYGIDPTSPDIHLGHLVPCRALRAIQDLGHRAVLIVGDLTALIGDPSGRNAERPGLSADDVARNLARYAELLFSVIDESKAELHYQSEWFGGMGLQDALKLLASFSVAQMLAHETFRARMESGGRLSLHELAYPVLQVYDSVMIKADIEIGGTDQKFNCLCGRELQRARGEEPQVVLTVPLLMGMDGRKMGKSLGNHIALADAASDMVGKVMSIPDTLIGHYARLATSWGEARIREVDALLAGSEANPRDIKLGIAWEVVAMAHGVAAADAAVESFLAIHCRRERLPEPSRVELPRGTFQLDALIAAAGLAASKSDARRLIEQGSVKVGGERAARYEQMVRLEGPDPVSVTVGKRRHALIYSAD
jgi:tyrosyl-tRNA synthetase